MFGKFRTLLIAWAVVCVCAGGSLLAAAIYFLISLAGYLGSH